MFIEVNQIVKKTTNEGTVIKSLDTILLNIEGFQLIQSDGPNSIITDMEGEYIELDESLSEIKAKIQQGGI